MILRLYPDFPEICLCHLQLGWLEHLCRCFGERTGVKTVAAILPQSKHVDNTDAHGFHLHRYIQYDRLELE